MCATKGKLEQTPGLANSVLQIQLLRLEATVSRRVGAMQDTLEEMEDLHVNFAKPVNTNLEETPDIA
jgi:hypothetical protein